MGIYYAVESEALVALSPESTSPAPDASRTESDAAQSPTPPVFTRGFLQRSFEGGLWSSRVVVVVPVIASMLIAFVMFYVATLDTIQNMSYLREYTTPSPLPEVHEKLRSDLIAHVVEAIDGYLLGVVMMIFSMGMYELFLHRIDAAVGSDRAKGILLVHSLDDLKTRLGQVILLMLIVKFFERALSAPYDTTVDLLELSVGIVLIAVALQLSHVKHE